MEYVTELNLLLEALAYLGRRTAGYTMDWLRQRLSSRGVSDLRELEELMEPVQELSGLLDGAVCAGEEELKALFCNLEGFPYNTIGSYSPAFLLLYPLTGAFDGDLNRTRMLAQQRQPEHLAWELAMALELAEESAGEQRMELSDFSARVLALSISAESKVAILELLHRPESVLEPALKLLEQVIGQMQTHRELLKRCCAPFTRELLQAGPEAFLDKTSSLKSDPERTDQVHPFLFGLDTLLAVTPGADCPVQLYCGILRRPLQAALASAQGPEYDVYNAIKLLADKTRFDILCYLRDHDAYGQELAQRFGLSRNTIHHHMSKLLGAHLVKCTVDGNRVYYTVDCRSVADLLDRQRRLLLP